MVLDWAFVLVFFSLKQDEVFIGLIHLQTRAVLYILGGVSNTRQIETSVMTVTV